MTIWIFEVNAFPTKFPIHSAQYTDTKFFKMSIPLIYILWRFDGKTEMLFQIVATLNKSLLRTVAWNNAMRFFRIYSDVLVCCAYLEEKQSRRAEVECGDSWLDIPILSV
jgi:hypothetical protein